MKRPPLAPPAAAALVGVALACACGDAPPRPAAPKPARALRIPQLDALPQERHLADLKRLTLGGENAEAYWSFGGGELVMQARTGDGDCDRIYRLPLAGFLGPGAPRELAPPPVPVSSGKGATTCSYFLPGDRQVIYASTHLGGDACPPRPDASQGYVWALYDSYDIWKADPDGKNPVRLTDAKGYDAEGTVCARDGSIVFTSTRDGDIDLYRMDADGRNVRRLTDAPGYDGGAFFNADCTKIVWRASRPRPGRELDDFRRLLGRGLVRPSKLELWVANADGTDARQITYLGAAAFAPFWHPSQRRVLFSTNYGDPKGREFDVWAVNDDGTGLERVTHAPGFDGFPMFSPDGRWLAFSSNRATPPGKHDTNVFVARWVDGPVEAVEGPADRVKADVAWLADPAREGRGVGGKGLDEAGAYVEARMRALGLAPGGDGAGGAAGAGSYRQAFPVATRVRAEEGTQVALDGRPLGRDEYVVMGYSPAKADVAGELVFAGYGIAAKDLGVDEYAKLDVKKKVVLVRRFVPEGGPFASADAQRRYGDLRQKAFAARERGAAALVVVDDPAPPPGAGPDWKAPDEAKLPALGPEGYADAGLPVVVVKRAAGGPLVARLSGKRGRATAKLAVRLAPETAPAFNVVGRLAAEPPDGKRLPGVVIVGAHYDHLGRGGHGSLAPQADEPHVGADDNASGTAVLLEMARELGARRAELRRDVLFVAFSGEESGLLGSAHFVRERAGGAKGKLGDVVAMLNLDMVGRMRDNRLQVLGAETAAEWKELLGAACDAARVECAASGDGYGPSDQMSFYAAGAPVLHFFTGTHTDYHKPSDTADKVNAAGAAQTGKLGAALALAVGRREGPLTFQAGARGPGPAGDVRSFNASLGTIPDYGGPGPGKKGVLLAGVRPGGGAERAGMRKGDVLVKLGPSAINGVEDLMFVLNASKPGETVPAVVVRDGKEIKLEVTFQESRRAK
jgi:Tol biopolymer transport system component